MNGAELITAMQWLYSRLIGGPVAARVFADVAPAGSVWPTIVYSVQSPGADVTTIEGYRQIVNPLFLVRAVTIGASYVSLQAIAAYIDTRLHMQTAPGLASCIRESAWSQAQDKDGVSYRQLGGMYRLYLI